MARQTTDPGAVGQRGDDFPGGLPDALKLPEGKRMAAEEAFRKMFVVEVGGVEPAPGASPWSSAEREAMRRALDRFKQLSPAQRSQVVNIFPKLATLSPSERTAFLRSADEWQRMSVEDRQAWKGLVKRVPVLPPMPPGIRTLPPLPVRSMPILTATNAIDANGQ
jgi:hypothetical protein